MILSRLERFAALGESGVPVALVTELATGAQALVMPTGVEGEVSLSAADLDRVAAMIVQDLAGILVGDGRELFVETWVKPLRLIVVGGVHVAQSLVPMARLAGYAVTLIEPRSAFGTVERFPAVAIVDDWPDEAIVALKPDRRTAIVTLSHDPKIDDPALIAALRSEVFYLGALGSRRSHANRRARLAEVGFAAREIDRIHGPVGLAIGAVSPGEIAISILAEMTAVLRGKAEKNPVI